jgi:hypothetical protein
MIVGTWQALFAPGPSNPLAPGFPIYPIFACPVSISTDGSLGTGDCTLNDNFTLTQQPSGKLTIDRTCHVVGSITYSICYQINGACSAQNDYVIQTSVSLWRSRDGSRLSGFQSWSCSIGGRGCGRTPPASVLPLELIEGNRGACPSPIRVARDDIRRSLSEYTAPIKQLFNRLRQRRQKLRAFIKVKDKGEAK